MYSYELKSSACKRFSDILVEGQNMGNRSSDIPYSVVLDEWLYSKRIAVKESTFSRYKNIIEKHIRPELGDVQVADIDTKMLECYAQKLLFEPEISLSAKTVTDIITIVKSALSYAKANGYSPIYNIGKIYIRKQKKDTRVFSDCERKKIVSHMLNDLDLYKLGVLLSLYTGIRIGELCALHWSDVSIVSDTINIKNTIQRIQNGKDSGKRTKIIITEPKSSSSVRTIPLPKCISGIMKTFESEPEAFVLTGTKERFCEPRTMQYHFKKYLEACKIEHAGFHSLRHTFATCCIEKGFEIKSLSEILGHSSVNITLNRYVHSSFALKIENMNKLSF